jgi:putative RNA 2'-phosphotransferase
MTTHEINDRRVSKFLSYVLRHRPEAIGLELDAAGWADVDLLIESAGRDGRRLTRADIERVVRDNDKQRFTLSDDGTRIRANQGHSVPVELGLEPAVPPTVLYHGTVGQFLESIRAKGLLKGRRHHVHLSSDVPTAQVVGRRRGVPIILAVAAGLMHQAGHAFYRSANGVWLTDHVPPEFLTVPPDEKPSE